MDISSVESVTLFWNLIGGRTKGRVCIRTPAIDCPNEPVEVRVKHAGALKVPTGWLIACDLFGAMYPQDFPSFERRFPVGEWPVEIYSVVHDSLGSGGTHLAAAVRTGTQSIHHWEAAAAAPSKPMLRLVGSSDELPPPETRTITVDGGLAAFVDQAGMVALGEAADIAMKNYDPDGPFFISLLNSSCVELECDPPANVVMFGAGVGDGAYPCFIGMTARRKPVALLMLFDTFDAERTAGSIA